MNEQANPSCSLTRQCAFYQKSHSYMPPISGRLKAEYCMKTFRQCACWRIFNTSADDGLTWHGPVSHGHSLRFFLLSPWINLGLALLRVGLLAALIWGLAAWGASSHGQPGKSSSARQNRRQQKQDIALSASVPRLPPAACYQYLYELVKDQACGLRLEA